uniref:G-protein coupled receptors family 1 profile domain-containing protein n=1 Tax=Paramormyrops kingsleyae TaxID=1676925 RepID=A0A3B3QCZ0_9TELE
MDDSNSTYAGEIPDLYDHDNDSSYRNENNVSYFFTVFNIVNLVTLVIGLPVVSLALYVVYRQFKANHVANVYIINLLISDIIQFLGRPWIYFKPAEVIFFGTLLSGIVSSLGFMVCIAMERYLLIAHPHWYRSHFTLKLSAASSLVVWLVANAVALLEIFLPFGGLPSFFPALLLIPLPFLLFFFVGTWRGLSKTITLSSREKKRILATLLLVIANYAFLFFPFIISYYQRPNDFYRWESLPFYFSPLLDPLLYIFIRKDTKHIMEEFPGCRKSPGNEEQTVISIAVSENTRSG